MGGSSGKGGSKTQTTSQSNLPPAWAMPLFEKHSKDTMNLYNSGQGGNVYQGQRVGDLSDQTRSSIDNLQKTANLYNDSGLQNLANGATMSAENLKDMASGKFLTEGNPYFRQRLDSQIDDMAQKVNSQMSGAGRLGSGANTQVLAKNTSAMLLQGLEDDYNRAMQNMQQANVNIDRANQNQLSAANNFYQGQSNANKNAVNGGTILDQNEQNKINSDWSKWEEEDNRGWNRLDLLQNAMRGSAGNYGTSNSKTTANQSPDLFGMAGNFFSKLIGK